MPAGCCGTTKPRAAATPHRNTDATLPLCRGATTACRNSVPRRSALRSARATFLPAVGTAERWLRASHGVVSTSQKAVAMLTHTTHAHQIPGPRRHRPRGRTVAPAAHRRRRRAGGTSTRTHRGFGGSLAGARSVTHPRRPPLLACRRPPFPPPEYAPAVSRSFRSSPFPSPRPRAFLHTPHSFPKPNTRRFQHEATTQTRQLSRGWRGASPPSTRCCTCQRRAGAWCGSTLPRAPSHSSRAGKTQGTATARGTRATWRFCSVDCSITLPSITHSNTYPSLHPTP